MEKILSLEDLENAENKMLYCTFDEKIEGIDCVTPIHADLTAKSLGDFVEISGNVTGVVNLECDLLSNSHHGLVLEFSLGSIFLTKSCLFV